MHISDRLQLTTQLMRHEGSVRDAGGLHVPYRCPAGKLTAGYGHNLDDCPAPGLGEGSRLTEDQARRLLEADILEAQTRLERCLPWSASLTFPRYAVLVNMAFNLGIGGLLGFKRTLEKIRTGDYPAAAKEMLRSKWAGRVGGRAAELARQLETGEWGRS